MAKKSKQLGGAPELPEEVTGPIEPEEILELDDKIEGPIDDKLADLLEEATEDSMPDETAEETVDEQDTTAADQVEPEAEADPAAEETDDKPKNDSEEDDKIDEAIEDIAASEVAEKDSDSLDDELAATTKLKKHTKPKGKFRRFVSDIWANPRKRWMTLGGTVLVVTLLALIPYSRYFILNTARVRSTLSLRVIDGSTLQPLKNVSVQAGGAEALTDSDGVAKLTGVKLGRTELKLEKRAFASIERNVTVGWGSNPMGDFSAEAVGTQYIFYVRDAFSGQPLKTAEATSGDGNAHADEDGKMVLTLDTAQIADDAQIGITVTSEGYRQENLNITVNNRETQEVKMVPAKRHVFVSKRSGNYDVYAIDADGKNEQRLVGGTGLERADITLIPHPSKDVAAYVATRENTRNSSGYLLSTLYIINTNNGDIVKIDQSEQIKVIGWTGEGRLVYVKVAAGASGTDPKRHRLMSFNNEDYADVKELASSNTFNDVMMASEKVYFAPSNIFNETTPGFYVINPDGTGQQTIMDREVFSIVRTAYDKLSLNTGNDWFQYVLGSPQAAAGQAPSSQVSRVYIDSPDGLSSLWIDNRDGKGVLLRLDKASGTETVLDEGGGLQLPTYWLKENYVIYRFSNSRETADYAINVDGGEPAKVADVTDTDGVSRWLYY